MAYRRDRFGIEYRPGKPSAETPWLLRALAVAALVALVYLSLSVYRRVRDFLAEPVEPSAAEVPARPAAASAPGEPDVSAPKIVAKGERPREVRNLLLKLDAAIAATNYVLQIATIEKLRSLPGAPAADLDDTLAKSLGRLNLRRLFGMANPWVKTIKVIRGNNASRIANEYGTTVKCLEKLNGNVASLRIGQSLVVMDHPDFRLAVYRKTRVADLSLNGKFFKRYYLAGEVGSETGSFVVPANTRAFLAERGIRLAVKDVAELEMLLPRGANMTVADFR